MTNPDGILARLRGGLMVSCQAYPGEPMRDPHTMAQVAQACVVGGAVGIRVQGPADIAATVAVVDVPVVGLWKVGTSGVFITPTLGDALAVAGAGAQIVAVDGTRRPRPDGLTLAEVVRALRQYVPEVLIMADCGSPDDAAAAEQAGVDLVGTTLAGYTGERPRTDGPDLEAVAETAQRVTCPVIAEGRYATPEQVAAALDAGAYAVCVGTAITHPTTITRRFVPPTRPDRPS